MDIYQKITDRLVEIIEQGDKLPWHLPWITGGADGMPVNATTGRPYRGINVLMLWAERMLSGFSTNRWLTYKQARQAGGHVRKGEAGTLVVFWKFAEKPETDEAGNPVYDEDGEQMVRTIPIARGYWVFNVDQCEDLPDDVRGVPQDLEQKWEVEERVETLIRNTGAAIRHGGERAFFSPAQDMIVMPDRARFEDQAAYYGTLFHELVHWTGHESRLARKFGRFGDHAYAFEELVAELGAAFVCARFGISTDLRDDHAAYISGWLDVLKRDRRAIFQAASHAARASDFIMSFDEVSSEEPDIAAEAESMLFAKA